MVYLVLVKQVGDLNFMHWSAHGGQAHEAKFKGSQELLDKLKAAHPQILPNLYTQSPKIARRSPSH